MINLRTHSFVVDRQITNLHTTTFIETVNFIPVKIEYYDNLTTPASPHLRMYSAVLRESRGRLHMRYITTITSRVTTEFLEDEEQLLVSC